MQTALQENTDKRKVILSEIESLPRLEEELAQAERAYREVREHERGLQNRLVEIQTNLRRLQKKGLVLKSPKQKIFVLTEDGKKVLLEVENRLAIFQKPWDKKLRLVFFDIPEKKKLWRNWLRSELTALRFQKILSQFA